MQMTEISYAIKGVILALTKLDSVIQSANDAVIHAENAPAATITVSPVAVNTTITPTTVDAKAELDDEGVAWNPLIHVDSKTQVASKMVKGGKAWRLKKNVDMALVESIKAQAAGATTATVAPINTTPPVANIPSLSLPGTPATPVPSTMPGLPVVGGNTPDPSTESRLASIKVIKELLDRFGLSWEDCKEIMVNQFGVAQNGAEVTFGGLKYEQFPKVLEYFTALLTKYEQINSISAQIYEIATPANQPSVDAGLKTLFGNFHTESVDGVHYSAVDECIKVFNDWLTVWKNWAAGN